ncbi:hypothetical protein HX794_17810 [Pseudomonas costantinii]|uniref:hypothetical protein n=1 Tax=Pseudomonas costantinii TaxID=168469 RepID=UPI0015A4CA64|nr:hypothetical protein [Pseudomonas costantinii]NVZ21489.1 hypothetical protein [Pseudomonas costantinii]
MNIFTQVKSSPIEQSARSRALRRVSELARYQKNTGRFIAMCCDEMVMSREHQSGRAIWRLYNGMVMMWYVPSSALIPFTDLWKFHNDNPGFLIWGK